jgi:hypothetical protein
MFWRDPLIYDLWGDIRCWWRVADYYEGKWKDLDTLKSSLPFGKVHGEPKIKLVMYQFGGLNGTSN